MPLPLTSHPNIPSRNERAALYANFLKDPTGVAIPQSNANDGAVAAGSEASGHDHQQKLRLGAQAAVAAAGTAAMAVAAAGAGANMDTGINMAGWEEVVPPGSFGNLSDEVIHTRWS